ncbi:MAG: hypothetical protein GY722_00205 [bacterium]|nr:hypothetical protein [bacterium]
MIRHLQVFGVNHRPDFEIRVADMLIAVEVKVGKTGQAIREGLGQSVVYARKYDFVIYLFADTSKTRALKNSTKKKRERKIIDDFWAFHNTRLVIV